MLQIKDITKRYKTGTLVQTALDGVSLNLRDNEFVSILGPSGSGKTTLLNIIGGLDRYDSGDLIINNTSTKKYKDRDWDSYRNHTIGFVFQSYNLIPHQSILANVELALTISGISRSERRRRAKQALTEVGLGDQCHKKPNQMSGGQMQRVAIARALVNDPDILLADEPTGALDTKTSIQVMELLKKVAADRLVVMVTHNPELAENYSTRIVKLSDGKIISDSNPYTPEPQTEIRTGNLGTAKMSFLTSLSLSFNNLLTKKARTLLTAFAGSIGIIGIALILALSTGVNDYITQMQKDTMSSYPITINAKTFDLNSILQGMGHRNPNNDHSGENGIFSSTGSLERTQQFTQSIASNNLTAFKKYLDDPNSEIARYIGENGVVYTYNVSFNVLSYDADGNLVDTNSNASSLLSSRPGGFGISSGVLSSSHSASNFSEMIKGNGNSAVSQVLIDSYDMLYGAWPKEYNEVVLVVNKYNNLDLGVLYQLGLVTADQYKSVAKQIENGETPESFRFDFTDICSHPLYLIAACDRYAQNDNGTFQALSGTLPEQEQLMSNAVELKITGVIRAKEDSANASISTLLGYTYKLTDYVITHCNESTIVRAQEAAPERNVLTGMAFNADTDEQRCADAVEYLSGLGVSQKAVMYKTLFVAQGAPLSEQDAADALDTWLSGEPETATLLSVYQKYIAGSSYDDNLKAFGKVSYDAPDSINIYVDSFEAKDGIAEAIKHYNETVDEDTKITYTDYIALLISSITSMVNAISYVLIAFVAVSLVVSCIMIGIITHISVLERTKEIGILRAIGASKANISQVFNAETVIIGLCSGLIGVGVSWGLTFPINSLIDMLTENVDVRAQLPIVSAVILVCISVVITVLGGLIPARNAAKKDPVIALRTE